MAKYPDTIDDAESLLTPVDRFSTKSLTTKTRALVLPGDTVIQVESTLEGFADEWGVISIEDEIIIYQGKTNNTFAGCIRGAFGTQPAGHAVGTTVRALMVSGFIRRLQEAIVAIEQTIGTTGSFNFASVSHEHSFLSLSDTPSTYSGHGGKLVAVKGDESGLEFITGAGGGASTFLALSDTPGSYSGHAGKAATVRADETGLEFTPLVPTSRQIIAGTGLSGGGDLSQDRTLSVVPDATVQRVAVRVNSGTEVGARRRINFIGGTNVSLSAQDDSAGNEIDLTISASGGAQTFLALSDTPASYSGAAGKAVAVKSDESGLEFVAWPTGGVGGSGSAGYLPRWTASQTLGNSIVYQPSDQSRVGINTSTPECALDVSSSVDSTLLRLTASASSFPYMAIRNKDGYWSSISLGAYGDLFVGGGGQSHGVIIRGGSGGWAEHARFLASGDLVLGGTSAYARLQIFPASGQRALMLERGDASVWITFHYPGVVWYSLGIPKDQWHFRLVPGGDLSGTTGIYMSAGGDVGIHGSPGGIPLRVYGKGTGGNLLRLEDAVNAVTNLVLGTNRGFVHLGMGDQTPHGYLYCTTGKLVVGPDGDPTAYFNMVNKRVGIGVDPDTTVQNLVLDVNGVVRIRGGNPAEHKVLRCWNSSGDATWATLDDRYVTYSYLSNWTGSNTITTVGALSSGQVPWSLVTGKPSTYPPDPHTHDDRYYTKTEIDDKLSNYSRRGHYHVAYSDSAGAHNHYGNVPTDGAHEHYITTGGDYNP